MGIHMVLILEAAILSRKFEKEIYPRSGVRIKVDVGMLGISVGKVEHAVSDVVYGYSFSGLLR